MLPDADPAGPGRSGWAERHHLVDVQGCQGGNPLIDEKVFAAPDAGIVIGLGLAQTGEGADSISAMEGWERQRPGWIGERQPDGHPDRTGNRRLPIGGVGHLFQRGEA